MLDHLMLLNSSGVVLFQKEFVGSISQPRMVASLIVTLLKFSQDSTGLPVSYIEMAQSSLSIVSDDKTKVVCIVFHSREDGRELGRLIASSLLRTFVHYFSETVPDFNQTQNLKTFQTFNSRVMEAIRGASRSIVRSLSLHPGVIKVVLVQNDTIACSTAAVDELALVANLQSLLTRCVDAMALTHDVANELVLEGSDIRTFVTRIPDYDGSLVVTSKKSAEVEDVTTAIGNAVLQLVMLWRIVSSFETK